MIDVVYLAYFNAEAGYGIDIVEKFLTSYKQFSAGVEHNLVIIAKNWTDKNAYEQVCEIADKNNAKLINLPDDGWDIGAYIRAARVLTNQYVFFLGSGVTILSDNWLLYTYNAFKNNSFVQLAGPMGSWEKGIADVFPNPHIRTCAFMIKRELFLEYAATQKFPQTKEDTWRMEHCANSLSNYIFRRGYTAAVVNSDGDIFYPETWNLSHTYIDPDDSKLMMIDKWVDRYRMVREDIKAKKEISIWGKNITKYPKNIVKEFSEKVNIFIPYMDLSPVVFSSKLFHPVFGGDIASKLDTEALKDNIGENISDKYIYYGGLTVYYWVWKNLLSDLKSNYVGFCQNFQFPDFNSCTSFNSEFHPVFINNFLKTFEQYTEEYIFDYIQGNDIILSEKSYSNVSVYEQYQQLYPKKYLDESNEIIKEIYPQYSDTVDEFMASNEMYIFGTCIMKKELLDEFFKWLFHALNIIEQRLDLNDLKDQSDVLLSSFRIERFLNIWLLYKLKQENLKVKTTTTSIIYSDMNTYLAKCLEELQKIKQKNINIQQFKQTN